MSYVGPSDSKYGRPYLRHSSPNEIGSFLYEVDGCCIFMHKPRSRTEAVSKNQSTCPKMILNRFNLSLMIVNLKPPSCLFYRVEDMATLLLAYLQAHRAAQWELDTDYGGSAYPAALYTLRTPGRPKRPALSGLRWRIHLCHPLFLRFVLM